MNDLPKLNLTALVTAVVALITAVGAFTFAAGIDVSTHDDGKGNKSISAKFHVNDVEAGDGQPTKELTVPAPLANKVAAQVTDTKLKDETPALAEQVAPGELTAAQEDAARIKATQPPLPTAGASQGFIGCRTLFVRNQSSRHGVRPVVQVLHYTVSRNIFGWADVLSIVKFFDQASSQASSHFVIDAEGNCAYIVPVEVKAWTQAAGNPIAISYEIINYGNELTFMTSAGYAKLRSVMEQVSARTGIPMRRGHVFPLVSGIVQHADGGYAWGGHHDIGPFPMDRVVKVLTVRQPVPKSVKWLDHRKKISRIYAKKCTPALRRGRNRASCAKLRSTARTLDRLLRRAA